MTNANNGWPGAPGVPENPERDGLHMLRSRTKPTMTKRADWCAREQFWEPCVSPEDVAAYWIYEGRFYTPAEVAARVAEARAVGMREAAGIDCIHLPDDAAWLRDRARNEPSRLKAETMRAMADRLDRIAAAILAAIEKEPTT
jgi:hypothetical protein